jgi:hypothetical protein
MKRITSRSLPTDPCVRGNHDECEGAEDGGPIYPGDVYLCQCRCHSYQVAQCGQLSTHARHVVEHGPDQPRNCPGVQPL